MQMAQKRKWKGADGDEMQMEDMKVLARIRAHICMQSYGRKMDIQQQSSRLCAQELLSAHGSRIHFSTVSRWNETAALDMRFVYAPYTLANVVYSSN